MELKTILKDLDEILVLNYSQQLKNKTIKKFGNQYSVIGIEPGLIKQISEILVSNMDNLHLNERVKLVKELVKSNIFEEVWLGYMLWMHSNKASLGLSKNEILSLRPKTNGLFSHLYASKILPPYIRIAKLNHTVLFDLINEGNLTDQLISLRTYLTIAKKSVKFRKLSTEMLENKNWLKDKELLETLSHIHKDRNYKINKSEKVRVYAHAV